MALLRSTRAWCPCASTQPTTILGIQHYRVIRGLLTVPSWHTGSGTHHPWQQGDHALWGSM